MRLRHAVRAGVVALATVAASLVATPAHAGNATFTGIVTDAETGARVAGVCVLLWRFEDNTYHEQEPAACTGADGTWSRGGLAAGTYVVEAHGDGWVRQFAPGGDDARAARRYVVTDPGAAVVAVAMERAGAIAGTVTDALTGLPVEGACVYAQQLGGDASHGCTGADGGYRLPGVRPGSGYLVRIGGPGVGYVEEFAYDSATLEDATRFTVTAGQTTVVDEDLTPTGRIGGTVTDAVTGDPVPGACLVATTDPASQEIASYTCADGTGGYVLEGLTAGSYHLTAQDDTGAHPRTWHPSATSPAGSAAVVVAAGATTGGTHLTMPAAAYVTGTVTRAADGAPLEGVCVTGVDPATGLDLLGGGPAACSDAAGLYTLGGLPGGSVKVRFHPLDASYLTQWAHGAADVNTASPVAVTAGQTTSGVDAALAAAGRITGRIVDAVTRQSNGNLCAVALTTAGHWGGHACAGADGTYEITGLAPGSYAVRFDDLSGDRASEFHPGVARRADATPVAVAASATVTGIDAELDPGGGISGVVVDERTGLPVSDICVDAYDAALPEPTHATACTGDDGRYSLRGLPTTTVKLRIFDWSGDYAEEWALDQPSHATATPVTVVAGAVTPLVVKVGPA